jgi:predicted Zn-dependent protease
LTDASKINRKPERVRIKTTTKAGTLDQVLRQFNIADKRLEEMAILNGMALPDQVPVGTMIKVIQQ